MADGGNTFRFSGETRNLLRDHSDFFGTLGEALQEAKLNLRGGDNDARSERSFKDDGSVEIVLIFPLDQDEKEGNGRIYLRDRFVFDPAQQKLKQFQRTFEYNKQGSAAAWTPLLEKLEGWNYYPDAADKDKIKRFASRVARSYSRPLTVPVKDTLKDEKYLPYLISIHEAAVAKNPAWRIKVGDPETHYNLIYQENDTLEVIFSTVVDTDADPANGRVFVNDKFILDAATHNFKEVKRSWSIGRDSRKIPAMEKFVEELNVLPGPDAKVAKEFIEGVVPELLKPEPIDLDAVSPKPSGTAGSKEIATPLPKEFKSGFAKRGEVLAKRNEGGAEVQKENLEIFLQVAGELSQVRRENGQGWLTSRFRSPEVLSAAQESEYLKQWLEAAVKAVQPGRDFLQAAAEVELPEAAAGLRKKILADPFLQRVAGALREPNLEIRAAGLLALARNELLNDKHLATSAAFVAAKLQALPSAQREAGRFLDFLQGKGSLAGKVEGLLPVFAREITNPKTVAAMIAAGPGGVVSESGGLWLMSKLGRFGEFAAPVAAPLIGISGEAAVFTTLHKGLESATRDPAKVFEHWGSETLSAMLLFGAFRVTHGAFGEVGVAMSRGKLGKVFGGEGLPAAEAILYRSETGRVRLPTSFTEIGAPLPSLTRVGSFTNFLLTHGGGVGAMYGAGALGRLAKLQPTNDQTLGGHLFDAGLFYAQAMLGFNIANRATGGTLFNAVAEGRMRLETRRQGRAEQTPRVSTPPVTGAGEGSTEAKAVFHLKVGEQIYDVHVTEGMKRIYFGRSVNSTQVTYPTAHEAVVNFAGAEEISNNHAAIQQDKSGVWFLGDLGSHYGTWVNGQPVRPENGPIMVKPGDLIKLGDLEFTLEVDGEFIVPSKPKAAKVSFPKLPQVALPPPEVPDVFPIDEFYKGLGVPKDSKSSLVIATLTSADSKVELKFYADKTQWTLPFAEDGRAVTEMYVDTKGRLFLSKDYEGVDKNSQKPVMINGQEVNEWGFLGDGDKIRIGTRDFSLHVLKIPYVEGGRVSSDPPAPSDSQPDLIFDDRDTGEFRNPLPRTNHEPQPAVSEPAASQDPSVPVPEEAPEDQPTRPRTPPPRRASRARVDLPPPPDLSEAITSPPAASQGAVGQPSVVELTQRKRLARANSARAEFETSATQPGSARSTPTIAEFYPAEYLAKLHDEEPPMVLHVGTVTMRADREHTSYVLGSRPDSNPAKKWQTAVPVEGKVNVANIHAEIAIGENGEWYLVDRITEQGTYLDRGTGEPHRMEVNEWAALADGDIIYLGRPTDPETNEKDPESAAIVFNRQSFQRDRLPTLTNIEPTPAPEFPRQLMGEAGEDIPSATFKVENKLWSADQSKTRYVFGQNPGSRATESSGVFSLGGALVSREHAEIFVDLAGRWWVRDLGSEHGTYVNGEAVESDGFKLLSPGDKIGLGAPAKKPGSYTIEFDHPTYLKWEEVWSARSRAPNIAHEVSQPAIALEDADIVEASVAQPLPLAPPLPTLDSEPPPSAPRRRAGTHPPATPLRRPATPPPPIVPKEPKVPSAPPPEEDFGELNTGDMVAPPPDAETVRPPSQPTRAVSQAEITQAGGTDEGMVDARDLVSMVAQSTFSRDVPAAEEPSPPSQSTRNENTAVFSIVRTLNPEAFGELAPNIDIRSTALLGQLFPFLVGTRDEIHAVLPSLEGFPVLSPHAQVSQTGSHDLLAFFDTLSSPPARHEVKVLPESVKRTSEELWAKFWLSGVITRPYSLKSDGDSFSFSSFEGNEGPAAANATFAIHLKPGVEARTLEAFTKHLLTLEVPIEVVLPITVADGERLFAGVHFNAENSRAVYEALLELAAEYPDIIGNELLPFSHQLLNKYDNRVEGIGVLEKHNYGTNGPLAHRGNLIKKVFSEMQRSGNAGANFDWKKMLPELLKLFSEKGFDLNQPGFRKGSAADSHEWLVSHSLPPTADELVLGKIKGK